MRPLKDVLLVNADKVLYVFYDFDTTQNMRYSCKEKAQVPNTDCVLQFCARCEDVEGDLDCLRCDKRQHSFREDTLEDLVTYLCEPRHWSTKIFVIAHNTKAFDLHFILNSAILRKW